MQGDATWNHNMFDLYVKHGEGDVPILCECIHFSSYKFWFYWNSYKDTLKYTTMQFSVQSHRHVFQSWSVSLVSSSYFGLNAIESKRAVSPGRWNSCTRYSNYVVPHQKSIGKNQNCHMQLFSSLSNLTSGALGIILKIFQLHP